MKTKINRLKAIKNLTAHLKKLELEHEKKSTTFLKNLKTLALKNAEDCLKALKAWDVITQPMPEIAKKFLDYNQYRSEPAIDTFRLRHTLAMLEASIEETLILSDEDMKVFVGVAPNYTK
jgi:hypothetical protein